MAGKKGATWSKPMTRQQRDEIAVTKIENILDNHRDGKNRLSISRLRAIELRYHKLRPSLSAVEQTIINDADSQSEGDIVAKLVALFQAEPSLMGKIQAAVGNAAVLQPIQPVDLPTEGEEHTTH